VRVTKSEDYLLQISATDASKSQALSALLPRWGIPPEQVAAIGDAPNDLDLLEFAGTAIAMGNAPPEVKDAADHVAPSNDDDGFASAVREFVCPMANTDVGGESPSCTYGKP